MPSLRGCPVFFCLARRLWAPTASMPPAAVCLPPAPALAAGAGDWIRLHLLDFLDGVVVVHQDDLRLIGGDLLVAHRRVGADDEMVAQVRAPCGCPVERDLAAAAHALDDVGGETLATVDVVP